LVGPFSRGEWELTQKVLLGEFSIHLSLISVTDQDFEQLEEICGFRLNEASRSELREIKKIHSTLAIALSQAPSAKEVKSELLNLGKAATDAAICARLLRTGEKAAGGILLHFSGLLPEQLEAFAAHASEISVKCQQAFEDMERRTSTHARGRARHPQLREYIFDLADFFERRGGKVSASYSDIRGCRNTPFVKFVWHLSAGMSETLGWPDSGSAMGEAVSKAVKLRRAAKQSPGAGSK
jgi:hypothetical protein